MIRAVLHRLFRPVNTTAADMAIAAAEQSQRDVAVRARALRMDCSCGDPARAITVIVDRVAGGAGHLLRAIYEPAPPPADMQRMLDDI